MFNRFCEFSGFTERKVSSLCYKALQQKWVEAHFKKKKNKARNSQNLLTFVITVDKYKNLKLMIKKKKKRPLVVG